MSENLLPVSVVFDRTNLPAPTDCDELALQYPGHGSNVILQSSVRIQKASVVLTNAQIITLPTVPVEIVPALGSSLLVHIISNLLVLDASSGAYDTIDAAAVVSLVYLDGDGAVFASATGSHSANIFADNDSNRPLVQLPAFTDATSFEYAYTANKALGIRVDNGILGDFTVGDPANTLKVTVFYVLLTGLTMAIAIDASTPIRWNGLPGRTEAITSAAFTAPTDALLVCCVSMDGGDIDSGGTHTVSDSGELAWTKQVERTIAETTVGAAAAIWTARTVSSVSRTAIVTRGNNGDNSTRRASAKLYVLTGVDVDGTPVDTVGANNEGGSTTNSINTTSITPGATGLLIVCDTDWSAGNGADFQSSSDLTQDTAWYSGQISVLSGYRTCSSGVGVTGNLNAGGAAAVQHKWCQIVVRAAATSTFELMGQASF